MTRRKITAEYDADLGTVNFILKRDQEMESIQHQVMLIHYASEKKEDVTRKGRFYGKMTV